ncbi:hypothetical protein [Levilactobacillus brevis]|uniref:hypothetical protein n=1 Tax=Levilactobacillus brevis TaxID=1580 RepID=UPI0004673013|nr:hypothetical protein [Levilactobacillus brevis]
MFAITWGTVEEAIEEASNSNEVYNIESIRYYASAKLNSPCPHTKKQVIKTLRTVNGLELTILLVQKQSEQQVLQAQTLAGFIPGWQWKTALVAYDAVQVFKSQNADVWPTYNLRLISATAPRGNRAIIGQESVVKYYSNSKRTNLKKTISQNKLGRIKE